MKFRIATWLMHLVITILVIGGIFYLGASLSFNDHLFLAHPLTQGVIIVLLLSVWAFFHLRIKKKNTEKMENTTVIETDSLVKEEIPIKLWKKTFPESKSWPIVLLAGEAKSGKSSLLLSLGLPITKIQNRSCTWFLYHNLIVIEVKASDDLTHWSILLGTLIPWRKRIIAFVACFALQNSMHTLKGNMTTVAQQLTELEHRLKRAVNTYLLMNQLDQFTGFSSFTKTMNDHQRQQLFCFNATESKTQDWINEVHAQMNTQSEQLQQHRLLHLESDHTINARQALYEFPAKLRTLSYQLKNIFESQSDQSRGLTAVKGIFLASMKSTNPKSHYFVQSFWPLVKTCARHSPLIFTDYLKNKHAVIKAGLITGVLGIIVTIIAVWSSGYLSTQKLLNDITFSLNTHEKRPTLDQVEAWSTQLNAKNNGTSLGLYTAPKLSRALDTLYKQQVARQLNPTLQDWFHKNLLESTGSELYINLRAYLMLGELNHRQKNVLETWRKNHSITISEKTLSFYLQNKMTLSLDDDLVKNARDALQGFPEENIFYQLTIDSLDNAKKTEPPFSEKQVQKISSLFQIKPTDFNARTFYTKKWFLNHYSSTFNSIENQKNQMDWVLNRKEKSSFSPLNVLSLYLEDYATFWVNIETYLQVSSFKNLKEVALAFDTLSKQDSAIDTLLQKLTDNTDFNAGNSIFDYVLSPIKRSKNIEGARNYLNPIFGKINQFFETKKSPIDLNYAALKKKFKPLSQELLKLAALPDQDPAIIEFVKTHRTGTAKDALQQLEQMLPNTPPPVRSWLQQLLNQIWPLLLDKTKPELNQQWQQQVMGVYTRTIDHRYPLDPKASQSITLEDFTAFYGPAGVLMQFYQEHVLPYMDKGGSEISLGNLPKKAIGLSDPTIKQLKKAQLIQHAFFSDDSKNAHINFALEPYTLSPNVAQVKLVISGQLLTYGHGPKEFSNFTWPKQNQNTSLTWVDLQGKEYRNTTQDTWGFFRLLQHASLQKTEDGLLVTFQQGDFSASFILKTESAVNPFTVFTQVS